MNDTQIAMAARYVVATTNLRHLQDQEQAVRMLRDWVNTLSGRENGSISSASYILHKETDEQGSVTWEFDRKVFSFYSDGDYFDWN